MVPLGTVLGYALWHRHTQLHQAVPTAVAAVVTMVPEGLILLTNDGDLAARLTHPRHGVPRVYEVRVLGIPNAKDIERLSRGILIDGRRTEPAQVQVVPSRTDDRSTIRITIREGRNREVRRIFEHFGYEVKRLDRKEYASITTRGLKRGEYRHLTRDEVAQLQRLVSEER